jgi:hypothetical protein
MNGSSEYSNRDRQRVLSEGFASRARRRPRTLSTNCSWSVAGGGMCRLRSGFCFPLRYTLFSTAIPKSYLQHLNRMSTQNKDAPTGRSSPRNSATGVRLGCGALLGVVLGVPLVLSSAISYGSALISAAEFMACVTVCAILSWRFGDRFYEMLAKWFFWLP